MSIVSYNGKRLTPAPFIGIEKSYYKIGAENVGSTYQITVQGTIVAFTGIPTTKNDNTTSIPESQDNTNNARLGNILRKQEIIRSIFSQDFKLFEVQSANGSAPMKCRPRILGVNFEDGIWFDTCRYTIQLEAPEISVFGAYHGNKETEDQFGPSGATYHLLSANENWSTEYDEERDVFLLSHSLSAQGREYYNLNGDYFSAITNAQNWINTKKGPKLSVLNSGLTSEGDFTDAHVFDYLASREINETDGSINFTENWVVSKKSYTEEYVVNLDENEEGKQITIQGSLQGLSKREFVSGVSYSLTKWASASGAWPSIKDDLYNRVTAVTQLPWVNPIPLSYSVGYNKIQGNIQYSYNYNNAPPNIIDNARFERITVNDDNAADVFAIIPILGRARGPIIQPIKTKTEKRRTVTIEVALTGVEIKTKEAKITYLTDWNAGAVSKPNWGAITGIIAPLNTRYIEQDQETFDLNSQRYSKVVTWVY